jgi:hypothetical protein
MNNAEYDALNDFEAPWRQRAREADAREASLAARLADLERRESEALAQEARRKAASAPATADEIEALESKRVVQWVNDRLRKLDATLENLTNVADDDFRTALRSVPSGGWPDFRTQGEHLADLRSGANVEPDQIEPEAPPDNSGLHRLLAKLK